MRNQPSAKLADFYNIISGPKNPTSTLVLFANNSELRTGGGFVGTVGLLNGHSGKVDVESIRSVYYFDHRIESKPAFVNAPNYMLGLIGQITVRDSLISISGNENARLARDLYARETGIRADNVLIVTPRLLQELLEVTGPIELPEYNLSITHDNIFDSLQTEVEAGKDKQSGKDPKTILSVLTNQLVRRLPDLSLSQLQRLALNIDNLISTKQLELYSGYNLDQNLTTNRQEFKPGTNNTFMLTAANHVANKSSRVIQQATTAVLTVEADGKAELEIGLQVTHSSDYKGKYIDPADGKEKWLIGDNFSWYQAILPNKSKLISGDGWADRSGGDQAVFGIDIGLKPHETKQTKLKVLLPYRYALSGNLVVDLTSIIQFGSFGQKLTMQIRTPDGYRLISGPGYQAHTPNWAEVTEFQTSDSTNHFVFSKK